MMRRTPLITLHSGALGTRSNSLEYLEQAWMTNPDIVEIDVRSTRDSVAVLSHDPFITTREGARLLLAEHDCRELREADPSLLTLEEALEFSRNRGLRLNLDLKEMNAAGPMIDLLKRGHREQGFLISGCGKEEVVELLRRDPRLRVLLNEETAPEGGEEYIRFAEKLVNTAASVGSFGLNIDHRICRPELIGYALLRDMPIFVWTADEEADMRRLTRLGVYSITTNRIDLLRRIVNEVVTIREKARLQG